MLVVVKISILPVWRFEKNARFLKLNCELMVKEQNFIFGREKVQTVEHIEK